MRLISDDGDILDAEFDIEPSETGLDVILHARSGGSASARGRNTAYFAVLEQILRRLGVARATITSIHVDSSVARRLAPEQRKIALNYPLTLSADMDSLALRVSITEGQRFVASQLVDGRPGGNKHKRIRISIDLGDATILAVVGLLGVVTDKPPRSSLGVRYRAARGNPAVRQAEAFTSDALAQERALAGHARVQNGLASHLRDQGFDVRSPAPHEPDYDLAWAGDQVAAVAEVKTLDGTNPVHQLRLGLGQVLQYRRELVDLYGHIFVAVLAVEYAPPALWLHVTEDAGVAISWPPNWPNLPRF